MTEAQARAAIYRRMPTETKIPTQTLLEIIDILRTIDEDYRYADELSNRINTIQWELDKKLARMLKRCCYGFATQQIKRGQMHDVVSEILAAEDTQGIFAAMDTAAWAATQSEK